MTSPAKLSDAELDALERDLFYGSSDDALAIGVACTNCGHLKEAHDAMGEKDEVAEERERCERIVSAARFGEIDQDFRTILHFIESGEAFPRPEKTP